MSRRANHRRLVSGLAVDPVLSRALVGMPVQSQDKEAIVADFAAREAEWDAMRDEQIAMGYADVESAKIPGDWRTRPGPGLLRKPTGRPKVRV